MSEDRKSNGIVRFLVTAGEVLTALSVPAVIVGILVSLHTTNKSIRTQERLLHKQAQMELGAPAYLKFVNQLLKGNTRAPLALYGSKEIFDAFLHLEEITKRPGSNSSLEGNPELQDAVLSFLRAISVHVIGEDNAPDKEDIGLMLNLPSLNGETETP